MKLFDGRPPNTNTEMARDAMDYAEAGGQALHVWIPGEWIDRPGVPSVFKKNNDKWAHLFDGNTERLKHTARRLGVKVIVVGRPGKRGQHVDLCGGPLSRAMRECE